jgi:hypothetical protein
MTATPTAPSAEATAARVEELLERLSSSGDPATAAAAEELVRALMDFYAVGLARIVSLLSGRSGHPLAALLQDEVAAGLLVLHDLHPEDVQARIGHALRAADADRLEVVGFDPQTGALTLRQSEDGSSGCGCPSTAASARGRAEAALASFAPEVTSVQLVGLEPGRRQTPLFQIGLRPGAATPVDAR